MASDSMIVMPGGAVAADRVAVSNLISRGA